MTRSNPDEVRRIACIGTGVIGGGWAAHFLARGYEVTAWDPTPGWQDRLHRLIEAAWPALTALGLAGGASPDKLHVADSLVDAVAGAEVVQESAPERLDLKRRLLAEIDLAAPVDTVICSSTSGFAMSEMQTECTQPERTVVGHPFNPPYLIPLVEVVGGRATDPDVVDWAAGFYTAAGKQVIRMERELPGFIANRLQEAIWREALHMVAAGEATVEDIDLSITAGPGLRWAFMGPCLTFHLAGGEGGMAHMLDHFGPSLLEPWTRLTAPPLDEALRDRMVEGCEREAGDRSIRDLIHERDACLVAILNALRTYREARS